MPSRTPSPSAIAKELNPKRAAISQAFSCSSHLRIALPLALDYTTVQYFLSSQYPLPPLFWPVKRYRQPQMGFGPATLQAVGLGRLLDC